MMRPMQNLCAIILIAVRCAEAADVETRASIEKQRQSIQRQLASVARQIQRWPTVMQVSTAPAPEEPAPPSFACEKIAPSQIAAIAEETAARHGLSSALIRAVVHQESGGNPCAVSSKGALGLMQIMPEVAQELQLSQPFDPVGNIDAGGRLLKKLLLRFNGDLSLAVAAYNAGAGAVERAGGVPDYPETQGYVAAILEALKR